jgi:hypothetical protein
MIVALNLGSSEQRVVLPEGRHALLLSTVRRQDAPTLRPAPEHGMMLAPDEGVILRAEDAA